MSSSDGVTSPEKAKEALLAAERKGIDFEKGSYEEAVFNKDGDKVMIKGQADEEFIGLSKEELEKYRDDPFWKRLRMFLFILFWLAWIAMFVAAIVIVIVTPKCPPKVIPHWWQAKISYQVWTSSFKDSDGDGVGDLLGLKDKLNALKKVGIQTIWPVQLLDSADFSGFAVNDFKSVDPRIGTNDDLYSLIKAAHSKIPRMNMIMDFPVSTSTSHEWFNKSASKDEGFADLYVWSAAGADAEHYSKDDTRNEFYLHLKENPKAPVLNWANEGTQAKMADVLHHWLDEGMDGFHVGHIDYMSGKAPSAPDWEGVYTALQSLSDAAETWKNDTENTRQQILIFSTLDEAKLTDELSLDLVTKGGLNYVINKDLMSIDVSNTDNLAEELTNKLQSRVEFHNNNNETWPMWEMANPYTDRLASRTKGIQYSELLNLVLLMLPGSMNVYYGQEIGMSGMTDGKPTPSRTAMQWNDEANAGFSDAETLTGISVNPNYKDVNFQTQYSTLISPLKMFRRIAKLRASDDTFHWGDLVFSEPNNNLLLLARTPPKNSPSSKTFFGLINFANATNTVNITKAFPDITFPTPGSVLTTSSKEGDLNARDEVPDMGEVSVEGLRGIIIKA